MTWPGWAQITPHCVIVLALVRPVGGFMTRLPAGERTFLSPILGPAERGLDRLAGIDPRAEQHWSSYALAMLAFNAAGLFLLHALLRLQGVLPLNPEGMAAVSRRTSPWALIGGFARGGAEGVGNFWADLVRTTAPSVSQA